MESRENFPGLVRQQGHNIDTELWQCENLDTHEMLTKFRQLAENVKCPTNDPSFNNLAPQRVGEMVAFHDKLNECLTDERLTRIQQNIMGLSEMELNAQAIRLELAVHKLSSSFDGMAEDLCNEAL